MNRHGFDGVLVDQGGFKMKWRTGDSKMKPFFPGALLQSGAEKGKKLRKLVRKWNQKKIFVLFPLKVRAITVSLTAAGNGPEERVILMVSLGEGMTTGKGDRL